MRIDAVVARGARTPFTVEQVELDARRDDEILVRIVATGLCHTDLATKAALPERAFPAVLGHEGAGVVVEVGAAVAGVAVGDHVLLTFRHCGECGQCRGGGQAYCERLQLLNNRGARPDGTATITQDGAAIRGGFFGQSSMAGHAIAYRDNVVVVDKDADLPTLAALGCGFQTGAGAVLNVLKPAAGAHLVVFGAGSVGLAALLAARNAGAATLLVVDPVPARRALAERFGAIAIDPAAGDVVAEIVRHTDGGATHALDTTGLPAVINQGLECLRARGALVVVGLGPSELTLDVTALMYSGKTLRGCIEGDSEPAALIPLLARMHAAGDFPIDELITRYPHTEINAAVRDQAAGLSIKPVLLW